MDGRYPDPSDHPSFYDPDYATDRRDRELGREEQEAYAADNWRQRMKDGDL